MTKPAHPLCIVGTTGSGKTALAVKLAKYYPSVLISADSRQVYRGMDIVTGKDHPKDLTLYGIDICSPTETCSVSTWYDNVAKIVDHAMRESKRVIVVGGTGLYVRALTESIATINVPINPNLRTRLSTYSTAMLQSELEHLDPAKYSRLNNSDRSNPRRLVRAIEVVTTKTIPTAPPPLLPNPQMIALYYQDPLEQEKAIRRRVLKRLTGGALQEIKHLLFRYRATLPSLSALGYPSLIAHLKGELTESEMVSDWVSRELKYAKRQLTYFRTLCPTWYDRGKMTVQQIYEQQLQS